MPLVALIVTNAALLVFAGYAVGRWHGSKITLAILKKLDSRK